MRDRPDIRPPAIVRLIPWGFGRIRFLNREFRLPSIETRRPFGRFGYQTPDAIAFGRR